ncbi:MAG: hypothetical protein ACLQT7_11805 [Candidatus Dormibacteria bacterium]
MQRPPVPGSVTLGRVLLIVEAALWLLGGLAIAAVGVLFLTAGAAINNRLAQIGYTGSNVVSTAAGAVGGTVIAFAVVIFVLAVVGIWAGAAMGRLSTGPRVTALVLSTLGLILGILSAVSGARTVTANGATVHGSAIPGIVLIVVNALIIWALGFSGSARAAFRSLPPPAYPMGPGYGPPPGYPPAYGQPPAPFGGASVPFGQPLPPGGQTGDFPSPPPPPPPLQDPGGGYPPPPPAPE